MNKNKSKNKNVLWFDEINLSHLPQVGGKNSSLGEMVSSLADSGIAVPGGFATTSEAFWTFIKETKLEQKINDVLKDLDVQDVLALQETGKKIREWILEVTLPSDLEHDFRQAYHCLSCSSWFCTSRCCLIRRHSINDSQ